MKEGWKDFILRILKFQKYSNFKSQEILSFSGLKKEEVASSWEIYLYYVEFFILSTAF